MGAANTSQNKTSAPNDRDDGSDRNQHLVVLHDLANIDGVVQGLHGGRKLARGERPDLERLNLAFGRLHPDGEVRMLAFMAVAPDREAPLPFAAALSANGFEPVVIDGKRGEQADDFAIQQTLDALRELDADVALISHDGDFADLLSILAGDGRHVYVAGLYEQLNEEYRALEDDGLIEILDLEHDLDVFASPPPRLRRWTRSSFDPATLLRGIPARQSMEPQGHASATEKALATVKDAVAQQSNVEGLRSAIEEARRVYAESGSDGPPLLSSAERTLRVRERNLREDVEAAPDD